MTWAIHHDLPKDESHSVGSVGAKGEYGAINQHLRNHIHLTNCIHLKNHMHRHSPVQSEKSLMRDLVVLQRSKSLRDPSTSPPSWLSPFVISKLVKGSGEDAGVQSGRRSIGVDIGREVARLSVCYPKAAGAAGTVGDHSAGKESRDDEIRKGEDCSRLNVGETTSHTSLLGKNSRLMTLSEQLEEIPSQTTNEIRTHRQRRGDERSNELKMSGLARHNGLSRRKRRKFRSARRTQGSAESKSGRVHNDISVASTSFTQGFMNHRCSLRKEGEEEENEDMDVTQAPRHGCGIPWNWSRIHHRGKTFLDIAGRSLSCGLSDSRLKKDEEPVQQSKKDKSKVPISSQQLTSSTGSDSESLPLLLDPSGSPESNLNRCMPTACSGELGLYADNNGREVDSDLVFEARSANEPDSRGYFQGRHQSLTQKYMPQTFKDLVGQSLVVQALTNAVLRRKVGLIYVFYGPHGTGKTSCARVFAKSLNCQSTELPKPCDLCTSCISHNLGKNRNLLEVGAVSSFDNGRIMDALNDAILSAPTSQYRVFIIDDCDILPSDAWMAISKVAHRAQYHVVLILVSSSLHHLPHVITSRCHKFYFPKIKESDIVLTLQWISTSEGLDIDKDALKLIASRSDGSLRDAEMTLDQLSLLGQRVSLPLVQELVGLVSDEKLVDLLDVALSADTVNTIKSLREITEAGVEPLSLMSQLATLITDILAGSYIFTRERLRRNFFRRQTLSKEDMEKLRQALRTLSETEKNLRLSTDKLTWLTAALLQIVPDQQYVMPSSLTDTNYNPTPLLINSIDERLEVGNTGNEVVEEFYSNGELNRNIGLGSRKELVIKNSMQVNRKIDNNNISGKEHFEFARNGKEHLGHTPKAIWSAEEKSSYKLGRSCKGYGKLWREVIENIQSDALKLFLSQEGKLGSVRLGSGTTMEEHDSSDDSGDSTSLSPERRQYIEYCRVVMSSIERMSYHVRDTRPCMTSTQTGDKWIKVLLEGHPDKIHDAFRMSKRIFIDLLHKLEVDHELQGSQRTSSREVLGITLYILAQGGSVRLAKERFQHSIETISRYFSKCLRSLLLLSIDAIKPIDRQFRDIPAEIWYDARYMPFFKDCVGAIDGTHVDARIPVEDQVRYIGRHGTTTQNVMAVCDFNMCFTFALAGWEGSAHDSRIFARALTDNRLHFPHPPQAPTVQLTFESPLSKSKAEKFRGQILQAFASVLNTTVILEIRCSPQRDVREDVLVTHDIHELESDSSRMTTIRQSISKQSSHTLQSENVTRQRPKENALRGSGSSHARELQCDSLSTGKDRKGKGSEYACVGEGSSLQPHGDIVPLSGRKACGELNHGKSLVKSKVSLAHVIQQAEGCSNQCGWSRHKAISIAEKLEQENMRLEPRSKSLLCWKGPRAARSKEYIERSRG